MARIAARLLEQEPGLGATDMFGPGVASGLIDAPALLFEDHSEISLFTAYGDHVLEYRSLLLAGEDDMVIVGGRRSPAFETYCRDVLGLGRPNVLRPASAAGPKKTPLSIRCMRDANAFRRIIGWARRHGRLNVVPYIGSGSAWILAGAIAEASGAEVRMAAPPPRLARRVNDKLWFSRRVEQVLGKTALPPLHSCFGPASLVARVARLSRHTDRVAIKVPDSAGSAGNIVIDSVSLRDLPAPRLRRRLLNLLRGLGWRGTYPLMVEVWDCPVVSSPSVQIWVPSPTEGPPIIEGLFDQVVQGREAEFIGAAPSALPMDWQMRLAGDAARLAGLFQELGYFGPCSLDAVLVGEDLESAALHWVDCNGRWGGVSIPMTLANRLSGDWRRRPFVVVQRTSLSERPSDPAAVMQRLGGRLYRSNETETGVVFLTLGGLEQGTGAHFMVMADTVAAARAEAEAVSAPIFGTQ